VDGFSLARPILFRLDPERAHNVGLGLLAWASRIRADPIPTKTALGQLSNPLGMPAGYDKTGGHLASLARLGFGYLVAGTLTASPWPGNPKPRVARNEDERALVNALGFPNPGVDAFISALTPVGAPVLASISGKTIDDVLYCYSKVQPHVAGVELNLSSPNTPDLRDLREPAAFAELARAMSSRRTKPTYLKTPPYVDEAQYSGVIGMVRAWESMGFDGVTASNSMPVDDKRMAVGRGGKSGPFLLDHTKKAVAAIRGAVDHSFELNACGGVSSPADAADLLRLGATTVQVFTGMVYQGPRLIKDILTDPDVRLAASQR
jgi:dihydroorotate dehydrogenase